MSCLEVASVADVLLLIPTLDKSLASQALFLFACPLAIYTPRAIESYAVFDVVYCSWFLLTDSACRASFAHALFTP